MASCSLLNRWRGMSPADRLAALTAIVHESMLAWGFSPVAVSGGYANPDTPAEFNTTSQTIEFQDQAIADSGDSDDAFMEIVGIALHEAMHAAEQQSGIAVPHSDVAYVAGMMAYEMFAQCQSAADSVPANLPPYPFQSLYEGQTDTLDN